MIKQVIDVEGYWKVVVYFSLNYCFFDDVAFELRGIGFSRVAIDEVYDAMKSKKAKAVTCSNIDMHVSIVIFNLHTSETDYINSIVHEAEHVKQAMLKAYNVEDKGEPPAYTVGYLVSQMYRVFARNRIT